MRARLVRELYEAVLEHATTRESRKALFGLLSRRERWGLAWSGWLVVLLIAPMSSAVFVLGIHPFLAVEHRVPAEYLVVEGWVADYAIEVAGRELARGGYRKVLTTGGPLAKGSCLVSYQSFAQVAAATLRQLGVQEDQVEAVPAAPVSMDRTRASAEAVRDWFQQHGQAPRALNVLTTGAHARRTRLTYIQVLGEDVQVGVITVAPSEYEPSRWWLYSAGIRSVIGELSAYCHTLLTLDR